ncbi:hypothetical protein WN944_023918 [Citrus x changshan-huyou]|uniref:Outer envelope protein 61 n=3 Tax=Citrus TaxID=2706 RepID=A0ACB8I030_CITSI|nr:Outer envelope protein 61 [Citrus sinensis]
MFNGMMDPEMIRLAQEQMNRMSPDDFARIQQQMMANPELMRIATENMKNMRPEDLKRAAEQLNHTRPEEVAEIGEKLANASPEEIATMRARIDAQMNYEFNAAKMLKKQGNELYSDGRFSDALQKYLLAKKNLQGIHSSEGRTLLLACSLNSMSCYLKTKQYDECIKVGSEVLAYDAKNVKALYRRGQAYKNIGRLEEAVSDLSNAHEVSPDDGTIADVLRDAKEILMKEDGHHGPRGLLIEEITEEVGAVSSGSHRSSGTEYLAREKADPSKSEHSANGRGLSTKPEFLPDLKDDPESIRSFQNFISNANPDSFAALSGGKAGEISPDMFKAVSIMINKMSPEELQRMIQIASSFQGENPHANGDSIETNFNGFRPGSTPPNMRPDMLKTASDVMSKMSSEDLQKMFEMESTLKNKVAGQASTAVDPKGISSDPGPRLSESRERSAVNGNNVVGQPSSGGFFPNSRTNQQSSFSPSTADLQQMRNQMNDPAMKQMFSSMIKNMSPEMMANMSEQFGIKLSREDTEKFQQTMSSLSLNDLDRMMLWADRVQRGVQGVKKTKNWLLGKPGMILAICMLILAVILHRLGFIGG